jgi:tetratricopeptide (TPR) repeat protein
MRMIYPSRINRKQHGEFDTMVLLKFFESKDIKRYRSVIAETPEDASAHFYLGAAYESKGWLKEAITAFSESVRLNPKSAEGHFNLGVLCEKVGEGKNAIFHITKAGSLFAEKSDKHNKERARKLLKEYYEKYGFKQEDIQGLDADQTPS